MGMQKVVIRITTKNPKKRKEALKLAAGLPGVVLAGIEGAEKDRLVVVGDGVDPVRLTVTLRKLTGFADLETVTPSDDNHKEGQHKEGKANKIVLVWPNFSHLLSLPVNISDF